MLYRITSDEPLVLLRVGGPNHRKQHKPTRIDIEGEEMRGDSRQNKKVELVVRDGEFFG